MTYVLTTHAVLRLSERAPRTGHLSLRELSDIVEEACAEAWKEKGVKRAKDRYKRLCYLVPWYSRKWTKGPLFFLCYDDPAGAERRVIVTALPPHYLNNLVNLGAIKILPSLV